MIPPAEIAAMVRVTRLAPLEREMPDGRREPVLAWLVFDEVLVHPDRWAEFVLWVNAPDVASHPELRMWFRERDGRTPDPDLSRRIERAAERAGELA